MTKQSIINICYLHPTHANIPTTAENGILLILFWRFVHILVSVSLEYFVECVTKKETINGPFSINMDPKNFSFSINAALFSK